MKETGHNELVVVYYEIDGVWEPSEQTTPEFTMHFLIKEGPPGNFSGAGIKHPKKVIAKSGRFRFIPDKKPLMASSSTSGRKRRVYVIFFFRFSFEVLQGTKERREQIQIV